MGKGDDPSTNDPALIGWTRKSHQLGRQIACGANWITGSEAHEKTWIKRKQGETIRNKMSSIVLCRFRLFTLFIQTGNMICLQWSYRVSESVWIIKQSDTTKE